MPKASKNNNSNSVANLENKKNLIQKKIENEKQRSAILKRALEKTNEKTNKVENYTRFKFLFILIFIVNFLFLRIINLEKMMSMKFVEIEDAEKNLKILQKIQRDQAKVIDENDKVYDQADEEVIINPKYFIREFLLLFLD